jgi:hypothetical protein
MASPTVQIPGRRISCGEIFYTGWVPRGGDCLTVIAECLIAPISGSLKVTAQTRGEDGTTVTDVSFTIGTISMSTVGVAIGICLASTSTSPGNGAQELVRLKVEFASGSVEDAYGVLRIFPITFFDSAKSY